MTRVGLTPHFRQIRGGTDGARLSFMGLPTPNLFAGEHNIHSRLEWTSVQDMDKAVEVIVEICRSWAETRSGPCETYGPSRTGFCTLRPRCVNTGLACPIIQTRDRTSGYPPMHPVARRSGRAIAWSRCSKSASAAFVSSSSRTASRTFTIVSGLGGELTWIRPASGLVTALDPIMRATGGVWVAHGSGSGDHETADERGRLARAAGQAVVHAAARLADAGRGARLLLRLLQPRALAALPHRVHAAGFRRVRLGAVRARQREVRRGRARRNRRLAGDRPRAGLSLCAAAAARQAAPPGRRHQPFLAHPLAAPRGVPHLPVAGRNSRRAARQRPARLPRAAALQQLSRDGRSPRSSRASTTSASRSRAGRTRPRCARFRSASTWKASRRTGIARSDVQAFRKSLGLRDEWALAIGVDRMDYTKGIPERLRAVDRFLERYPVWRKRFVFLQMGAPSRTEIIEYQAISTTKSTRWRRRSTPSTASTTGSRSSSSRAHHGVEDIFAGLPRGQRLRGIVAARRHESGRQGVRRGARRSTRRADPLAVHRRRARDARSAARESVCHRRIRRRAQRRADDARPTSSSGACSACARRSPSTTSFDGPVCSSPRRSASRSSPPRRLLCGDEGGRPRR